ncbi:type IX secretion system plug protein [Ornithobacterium rhinotracheale]|uniref:type IX secretion system plug protein n=2 Tax=Ornithobacterium rhinotracheale TaxID=28251 RepID=UPI001FF3383F|nr:DUF5103 domain-containing protein [Ornithobacterium rhinotracheale]MCK0206036.1 DUF5103 domain-containing protein [Ornithobacterium rhinotracheale]
MRNLMIIICLLVQNATAWAQLKTIQLFNPQTNDHTPVVKIGENLIFSFDDLNQNYQNYDYKIVRYNRNWEPSAAFVSEFLEGAQRNRFRNYKSSFNTRVNYMHYEVKFPNADFSFKLSGNYGIQLLKSGSNEVLAEKRFYVVQPLADVGVSVERINNNKAKNQRVAVVVNSPSLDFFKSNDYDLFIMQNNNPKASKTLGNPTFTQSHQLIYKSFDTNFAGGAEFEFFDTKNIDIAGMTTQNILRDRVYNVFLYRVSYPEHRVYEDQPDLDGDYYIRNMATTPQNSAFEADYAEIHFFLEDFEPKGQENVCVVGAFNDFSCTDDSVLHFNSEFDVWETKILLKQGYYNYSFATRNEDQQMDYASVTGSFWETENKYSALLYIKPWGQRYDLLVGYGEGYSKPPYK